MKDLSDSVSTGAKVATGMILAGLTLGSCSVPNEVGNYTPVHQTKHYRDKNKFQINWMPIGGNNYAIQTLNRHNTRDSLLDKNIYFKATHKDNLTLKESGGNADEFIWRETPIYFKATDEKIYLGKVPLPKNNKPHQTHRDWKTRLQDFFDDKMVNVEGIDYLTKKIGDKLYMVEAPLGEDQKKFKESTNFGTRDYFIQAKQGQLAIYVADLSQNKKPSIDRSEKEAKPTNHKKPSHPKTNCRGHSRNIDINVNQSMRINLGRTNTHLNQSVRVIRNR